MPIEIVLDSLDSVDEAERSFFVEADGKYKLDWAVRDAAIKQGLVAKNADLLKRLNAVKPIADKFKGVADEDWQAYQEWKAGQHGDDEQGGEHGKNGDGKSDDKALRAAIRAETKRLAEAHAAALKAKDDEVAALERKFEDKLLSDELEKLALDAGVVPKRLESWMRNVRDRFQREDGELVYLEKGKPSAEITPEKAVREVLFKEFDYLYEAREAGGGSGAPKHGVARGDVKTLSRASFEKLDATAKMKFVTGGGTLVD